MRAPQTTTGFSSTLISIFKKFHIVRISHLLNILRMAQGYCVTNFIEICAWEMRQLPCESLGAVDLACALSAPSDQATLAASGAQNKFANLPPPRVPLRGSGLVLEKRGRGWVCHSASRSWRRESEWAGEKVREIQ